MFTYVLVRQPNQSEPHSLDAYGNMLLHAFLIQDLNKNPYSHLITTMPSGIMVKMGLVLFILLVSYVLCYNPKRF